MNTVETGDIFRGAYLLCCGGRIGATRLIRGQVLFEIEGCRITEEDLRYRTGEALVNPLQLRETLNLLRDCVFERLKNEKRKSHHGTYPTRRNRPHQTGSIPGSTG